MNFTKYIEDHGYEISPEVLELCVIGLRRMDASCDPLHLRSHIDDMFQELPSLLATVPRIGLRVDYEVLLLAIIWHDVWKAKVPSTSFLSLIVNNIVEGHFSAYIFLQEARRFGLKVTTIFQVMHAITYHSVFFPLGKRTYELMILYDLDTLELWNMKRMIRVEDTFIGRSGLNRQVFYQFVQKIDRPFVFFEWTRLEIAKRRQKMLVFAKAYVGKK